jgi:hypothetical protein
MISYNNSSYKPNIRMKEGVYAGASWQTTSILWPSG